MSRSVKSLMIGLLIPVVTTMFFLVGCQTSTSQPAAGTPAGAQTADGDQPANATSGGKPSQESRIAEALAKLSEEDRKLAMSQKFCPVSDAPLGTMDAPVKVNVKGRDVFICCAGCEDSLKAEADKYLAKLSPQPAK